MSLHDIAAAANELAVLLEAATQKPYWPRCGGTCGDAECEDAARRFNESAKTPKGLKHPRHSQHVSPARKRIKALMSGYFDRQRKAVLSDVKPRIRRQLLWHPQVAKESAKSSDNIRSKYSEASTPQGKTFARSLVPTSLHPLTFAATGSETSEYNEAITDLISAAAKSLGSTAGEDLASTYLRENSLSRLTGNLAATTTERLQDALATAWDEGGSYDQMVAAINATFKDFFEVRAGLIAQTESADAYNAGRFDTARAIGYQEKSWETESGDPCPTCEANEAQGWIDLDEDFDSGDDAPTAHPNCLCVVNFRKSDEDEE